MISQCKPPTELVCIYYVLYTCQQDPSTSSGTFWAVETGVEGEVDRQNIPPISSRLEPAVLDRSMRHHGRRSPT